ncbi:unnamed protein product [Heterobilharzia americana]|nr:unnamed protein product [Heterobilharzia americana]
MIRLVSLESKIKGTLDDIVQVCISCPVLSSDYITCLTSLSHIGLLFPDSYNHEIKRLITKSLVQVLASEPDDMSNPGHNGIQINSTTSNILAVQSKSGENTLSSWSPDGLLSVLTRAKLLNICISLLLMFYF